MTNHKTTTLLIFAMGTAIGSLAAWGYLKKRYAQIAQDEIDSVKATFSKRETHTADIADETEDAEATDVRVKANQAKEKPEVTEYTAKLRGLNYADYSGMNGADERNEDAGPTTKPYVIPPDDFGEFDEYEQISLTYYADHILTDDNDERLEDIEEVVGFESLGTFGQYEDDSVFVRNDRLKCDYEILLDHRNYSEVVHRMPRGVNE